MYKSECNSKRRRFSHNYHWQILWPVIDPNLWERISTMTNKILLLLAQFTSASVSGLAQAMASLQGRFPCSFLYCSIRLSTSNNSHQPPSYRLKGNFTHICEEGFIVEGDSISANLTSSHPEVLHDSTLKSLISRGPSVCEEKIKLEMPWTLGQIKLLWPIE